MDGALGGAGPGVLDMMRPLPTQQRAEAAVPMPVARKGSGNIAGRVCKGGGAGGWGLPALGARDQGLLWAGSLCVGPHAAGRMCRGSRLDFVF